MGNPFKWLYKSFKWLISPSKSLILIWLFLLLGIIAKNDAKEFPVPSPPLSEGIFPCSLCHAGMPVDTKRKELKSFHTEIVLNHGANRWCFDCHNPPNRDRLRLSDGQLIKFEESYYLCGQCHGTHFRDWRAGIHGKRTGMWNSEKQYRLCVHCHSPHQPRFKPLKPMPPPLNPVDIK